MPRSSQQYCCVYTALATNFRVLLIAFCFLVSALCFPTSSYAQSSTATLSGTVEDQTGAVVPGASIALINVDQGTQRLATSDSAGSFVFPLLPPGRYSVTATASGFAPVEFKGLVLNVNDQRVLKIQLSIGTVSQTVEIADGAALIDESPAVATLVDRQFVANLPLNGRSFQSLITLSPGVVLTKATGVEQGQFSVNGQRADANYFTIDGVSANVGSTAGFTPSQALGGSIPGLSASGGTNNLVSVDALQEFKIQTSTYAPEFGRQPGAQVQILTRSGTNDFHGAIFDYFRNDALDAADWFTNANRLSKAALRQNDFGAVLGGPALLPRFGEGGRQPAYDGKNRTFFFFSYEGLRLRQPVTTISDVPSVASRLNSAAQTRPLLNAYPIPNGPNRVVNGVPNGLAQFAASFSNPSNFDATSFRIDHILSDRLSLFGRYNHAPSETTARSVSNVTLTQFKTQTLTGGLTWVLNSLVNNELRANYSRTRGSGLSELDDFGGAVPLADSFIFPSFASPEDAQFNLFLTGAPTLTVGKTANHVQQQLNFVDTLSLISGSHQVKLGVDYRRLFPNLETQKYVLQIQFLSVAAAVSGRANNVFVTAGFGDLLRPLFINFSAFAQDTWKVNRRLSLTYGLRWEYNPPPSERSGNDPFTVTGLDNPSNLALAPRGTPLWTATHNNFAPRVGIVYQLRQNPSRETVLRGGFGVFYDLGSGIAANAFGTGFPYRLQKPTLLNVLLPLTPTQAAPPPLSLNPPVSLITVFDPEIKLPRTYQWNLALEQSLDSNQTISASYVAAIGRKLLRQERLRNPNTNFALVSVTRNTATSDYHAMQLEYQRRLTRGLQALASYTWSHSLDIASNDSGNNIPERFLSPGVDRGNSDFDVRHSFSAAATYALPEPHIDAIINGFLRDWSLDMSFIARSATPVDLVGSTASSIFQSNRRPDVLLGIPLYVTDPAAPGGRRFNRAAFVPPVGLQGTLGRNVLRGFSIWQVDLALRRQFRLTEKVNLQFRTEAFNIFNHPNFGDPIGIITSGSFGLSDKMFGRSLGSGGVAGGFSPIYQIGGARSMQFALKLQF